MEGGRCRSRRSKVCSAKEKALRKNKKGGKEKRSSCAAKRKEKRRCKHRLRKEEDEKPSIPLTIFERGIDI